MIRGWWVQHFYSMNGRVELSEFNKYDNINHKVPSCDHDMFCRSFEFRMKTCTCNIKVRRRKLRGRYRAIWWWSDNYGMGQTQKLHSRYARVNSTEAMRGKMVKITSNIIGCILGLTQMHRSCELCTYANVQVFSVDDVNYCCWVTGHIQSNLVNTGHLVSNSAGLKYPVWPILKIPN